VTQVVEALRHEPEGSDLDSRWCHWNFSLTSFRPYYVRRVDSASNWIEYKVYFLGGKGGQCVGLTTLPPTCADCLEIWEPPGTLGLLYNSAKKAAESSLCLLADGTVIDIGIWSFHANINTWSLCKWRS